MTYNRVALVTVVLLGAFMCSGAVAEEIANDACLACHGVEDFAGPDGRVLFVNTDTFGASVHAPLPCTTCHTDIAAIPHEEKPARVAMATCAMCHGDEVATYEKSVHGKAQAHGTTDAATCKNCHGSPHGVRRHTDPASSVYPLNLPRACGACHGDPELAARHGIPVVNAYQLYMDSIHGRALTGSGLLVAANCSSCHGFHDIQPKDNPDSKVFHGKIPSTCGNCHAGVQELYFKGVHGQGLKNGKKKAPVCIDCHTAHQIARVDTEPWKLRIISECGTCHEESLKTYRDTLHGQVTNLGFTPVARCSDCHGSHFVLPVSNPESSVSPQRVVATCQKCHPGANANFARFSPHADPGNRDRNPLLYYTAQLMTLLIVGTFAFFGLHTVLWLIRSLIEHRSGTGRPDKYFVGH